MAFSDKGLEDQLMEVGSRLASPPTSVEELLPLLDQTESCLSRVEQSPSQSMLTALNSARKALVAKDLLGHSDLDVKVAVASSISEITRITAPEAPYEDDLMKEAFELIVGAFEKLDDTASRSYAKRVSILETVAKVRSCVVMLDLECDALILEMFHHFLKSIRPNHSENVFSSMETIMRLVLEESEDISPEVLSCLLHNVKKDNKDVLPIAHKLAEKVISNCAVKLKPYLVESVQSLGCPLSEYSDIVLSICRKSSEALEQNDVNASSECLADDSKLSERTVSDELPQGSVIQEPEVVCPEEVGTAADKSPRSVMSNGTARIGNVDSTVGPTSPDLKPERSHRSGHTSEMVAARTESENLDSFPVKPDAILGKNSRKGRFRKPSTIQRDNDDRSQIDSDKDVPTLSSRKDGRVKEASADGPSGREAGSAFCLDSEKKDEFQVITRSDNGTVSGAMAINDNLPDATRPRRGRPPGAKPGARRGGSRSAADMSASPKGFSRNDQSDKELLLSKDPESRKEADSDLEGKALRHSIKKLSADNCEDGETPVAKSPTNMGVDRKNSSGAKALRLIGKIGSGIKVAERRSSGKRQKFEGKSLHKGKATLEKEASEELSLKGMVSSPGFAIKTSGRVQSHLDESVKSKSRRKRALGTGEISESLDRKKELGDNLVGSKIKVWWPDDKLFYDGVVESFDSSSKKHKILYVDGDVEVLLLKNERWEFIEDDREADGGQGEDLQDPDTTEMRQRNKKARAGSDSMPKQSKRGRPRKSEGSLEGKSRSFGTESGNKQRSDVMKPKGRRKDSTNDETPTTLSKSKEKALSKHKGGTPKTSSKFEDSAGKSRDKSLKISSKAKGDKSSGRLKDGTHTPRNVSRSKDDAVDSGSKHKSDTHTVHSKSNEDILKAGRKRKGIASSESGKNVKANGASKGKSKFREHEASSSEKAPESEDVTAKKRRRKGGS